MAWLRGVLTVVLIVTAVIAEVTVLPLLGLPGAVPDAVTVTVVAIGFRAGPVRGSIAGLLAGLLIEQVGRDGHCESSARLFDGRRASAVTARTKGEEMLEATTRSSFAGRALRCDFEARVVAGFRKSDDAEDRQRPYAGSAWFARVMPDAFPVPVQITFDTKRLGTARMYLTAVAADPEGQPASVNGPAPAATRSPPSR